MAAATQRRAAAKHHEHHHPARALGDVIVFSCKAKYRPPGAVADRAAGTILHSETIVALGGRGAVDASVGKHGAVGVFERQAVAGAGGLNVYCDRAPPVMVLHQAGAAPAIVYKTVAMQQEVWRRNADAKGNAQTNTLIEK